LEFLDGWVAQINQRASSVTFDLNVWTFSGPNALDGETTIAASATPVPVKRNICVNSVGTDPVVTDPKPTNMSTIMDVKVSGVKNESSRPDMCKSNDRLLVLVLVVVYLRRWLAKPSRSKAL
jgi:hypothetical protein